MTYRVQRILSYYARPASYTSGGVRITHSELLRALGDFTSAKVCEVRPAGGDHLGDSGGQHVAITHSHRGRTRLTMIPRRFSDLLSAGDLVILHEGWTPSNIVAAVACRRVGVPYVVLGHGAYNPGITGELKLGRLRVPPERALLEHAAVVLVFFPSEISHIRRVAPSAFVSAIPFGYAEMTERWDPELCESHIGWIGRYDIKMKGLDLFLESLARVPGLKLKMHGQDHGDGRAKLEQLAHSLGITERVTIGEALRHDEIGEFFSGCRAFVHCPRWESFGRTIIEALSVGVPLTIASTTEISSAIPTSLAEEVSIVELRESDIVQALKGYLVPPAPNQRHGARLRREWARHEFDWQRNIQRFSHSLLEVGIHLDQTQRERE